MKYTWKNMMGALIFGIALLLAGCSNGSPSALDTNQPDKTNVNYVSNDTRDLNNPSIIPSEISDKTRTTNEDGTTYSGMGQNIYSSIGSSGIHEGGISSYFESILEGQGITGVKVFIVDDSVVLARKKAGTTSHEYDNMQRDLLSGTEGMSGKGEPEGVNNTQNENHDNLHQAKDKIDEMFNGNVKILTVTDPDAVTIIERIKEDIKSSSYEQAADDLLKLLNMTK